MSVRLTYVRFYSCVCVCVCVYKSRLRFGFVCKPRFNFRFVSVETCLFVCLCIYNQCDLFVYTFINRSLIFNLYVQTKVTLLVVNVYTKVRIQVCACRHYCYNDHKFLHCLSAFSLFCYLPSSLTSHTFDSHYQCLQPRLHCL